MFDIMCNILWVFSIICCGALTLITVFCTLYVITNIIKEIKERIRGK